VAPDSIAVTHAHRNRVFGLSGLSGIVPANTLTCDRTSTMASQSWKDPGVARRVASGEEYSMARAMLGAGMPGDRSNSARLHMESGSKQ
jgi:hypothetical protein